MDIVNAVLSVGTTISNWFSMLISSIGNLFSSVVSFTNYLISIIKTVFYGLGSLLSGVRNLVVQVLDGGVFSSVGQTFGQLATYIGVPATIFISSLLLLIIFRIGVAFVFKLLRLNIDYHSLKSKSKTWNQHDY